MMRIEKHTELNLADDDNERLETLFDKMGEKPFRARQLIQWIHKHGVIDITKMTSFSTRLRESLNSHYVIDMPRVKNLLTSADGTTKLIIELVDKNIIEVISTSEIKISVLIDKKNLKKSVEILHQEFKLNSTL